MKKILIPYTIFILMIISLLSYHGCSELYENPVQAPVVEGHPAGWADTDSPNFHGKYIFDHKQWNLTQCQTCHGVDYKGGSTGSSCLTCHTAQGGPQNCRLCHGTAGATGHTYPPKALNGETSASYLGVGAHNIHLSSDSTLRYSSRLACSECHLPVTGFAAPNHIGPNPDGIAEITFGTLARNVLPGDTTNPDPSWDRNTATCSNSYCHGNFRSGNRNAAPVFNQPASVTCGSCHGDPVSGNPNPGITTNFASPHFSYWTITECYLCHNQVINPQGIIFNKSKHLNGEINLNELGDLPTYLLRER
jgi:predicted CxxxxCH...CXXCH cytochrome family protein